MDFEEELLYFKAVSSPKLPLVKLQLMLEKCLGAMHSQICCGPGDSGSQTCRRQAPPPCWHQVTLPNGHTRPRGPILKTVVREAKMTV